MDRDGRGLRCRVLRPAVASVGGLRGRGGGLYLSFFFDFFLLDVGWGGGGVMLRILYFLSLTVCDVGWGAPSMVLCIG